MKHKWAKEIKAWADGAEIETKEIYSGLEYETAWFVEKYPNWDSEKALYRVKQKPKEPQYLYVWEPYDKESDVVIDTRKPQGILDDGVYKYIGKIPLITENDNGND